MTARHSFRLFCEYMASPNHIPQSPAAVPMMYILTIFWILLLGSSIAVNKIIPRCSENAPEPIGHSLLFFISMFAFIFVALYLVISSACRYFLRIRYQSTYDANRTKLAMCTPGLCSAQKQRISKTNLGIDAITFVCESMTLVMQFTFFLECSPESDCIVPCVLQPWIPSLPFFVFAVQGIMLKTCLVCSEFDYCVQSQTMEAFLNRARVKGCLSTWLYLIEKRQQISVPLCLLFSPIIIIEGGIVAIFIKKWDLKVFHYIGMNIYVMGAALLVSDGVILLPWALYTHFQKSRSKRDKAALSIWRRPFNSRNLPFRKAVPLLFFPCATFASIFSLNAHEGGPRIQYFICNTVCLFCVCLFFVWQLSVVDMPASIKILLQTSDDVGNFGLVMSRKHFADELKRIQTEHAASNAHSSEGYEISVPTYLASQARIELCVVVSYRWSDEKLYKKKCPDSHPPVPVIKIKHSSCDGFDWTVCLIKAQVDALAENLANATEPYVWMDQFSIPQISMNSSVHDQHEKQKQEVRTMLIPKMTGLYSCCSRVLALNNSMDAALLDKEDLYQNRLWCIQEYCLPSILDITPKLDDALPMDKELTKRRSELSARWFTKGGERRNTASGGLVFPIRGASFSSVVEIEHIDLELSRPDLASAECLDIILDWMEPDVETLEEQIKKRVQCVGTIEYLKAVDTLHASNTNDTLSALAQSWFGIILTKEATKKMLIHHIAQDAIKHRQGPLVVIDYRGVNPAHFSGSCALERMLSRRARGMETGQPVEVMYLIPVCP
jgi:hypothetical protein